MANNKYICIHGHFYQPPRENAWLEEVELQEGAQPFHDWNELINFQCYAPNAAARILNTDRSIRKIVNNYEKVSFNFGPTLLSWLEKADPPTYQQIIKADKTSLKLYNGHGNAIAQVYNHMIMPLANERDKETQVLWGIADFEYRFGRKPEGMWLAETAVDLSTLEVLVDNGIAYTILAPRQAKSFRKIGEQDWTPSHESIDPRRAYRCELPSGKHIALFFYDGNIAKDVAFERLLEDGKKFANRMLGVLDQDDSVKLAHIATDGETYGHHHRFGEMALASCLDYIEENDLATITNYGEFLEKYPPEFEVLIHENSSWSCAHGVERWRSDCGCHTGGQEGWNQAWRGPLRDALDWLRDLLIPLYEAEASGLVKDVWAARNDYISLILNRTRDRSELFIRQHAARPLTDKEKTRLLRLLEMQRHCMLMYTSCAWFFSEISGIETDQVLQYALRAMQYARYVTKLDLREEFEKLLKEIPSNYWEDGSVSYRQNVVPTQLSLTRAGMHYAVSTLFEDYKDTTTFMRYKVDNEVLERVLAGFQKLSLGRTTVVSERTYSRKRFSFAVLYLGQQNMIGGVSLDMDREQFDRLSFEMAEAFRRADIGEVINQLQQFSSQRFSFKDLSRDEKRSILKKVMEKSLPPVETVIMDYYEDNYQLMNGVLQSHIPVPDGWQNISQYVFNRQLQQFFTTGNLSVQAFQHLAGEKEKWKLQITDMPGIKLAAGERIFAELKKVNEEKTKLQHVRQLIQIIEAITKMGVEPELWKSQNLYYEMMEGFRKGEWVFASEEWQLAYLELGKLLNMSGEG